jgi:ribosomal protein L11 methyltransferase
MTAAGAGEAAPAGALVRLGIRVHADRAEEALARLLPLLAGGAEERVVGGAVEYAVYAPEGELPPPEAVRALAGDTLLGTTTEPVRAGWERRFREFLRPVEVGGLVVRPPWSEGGPGDLVIDPGATFGAGGHPTTRLCLELLLGCEPGGGLCDWGAGSGVLAVAAARLGWDPVTAVELDPAARPVIEANAAANAVDVAAVTADLLAGSVPWAPTVTANLTAPLHERVAAGLERPPERLIASGMLDAHADAVAAAYRALGLRERERRTAGGWAALVLA